MKKYLHEDYNWFDETIKHYNRLKQNKEDISKWQGCELIELLISNGIKFTGSNVDNIILIRDKQNKEVNISLVAYYGKLHKVRYANSNKWYTFTLEKIIEKFKL